MRPINIARVGLWLRLRLGRLGAANIVAIAFMAAGVSGWAWFLPHLQQENRRVQMAISAAQKSLSNPVAPVVATPASLNEQRLQQFYDVLGESRYAEQQVKSLFAIAAKHGLALNQAEYKYGYDKSGKFHTYTITLPVKGTYAAIRPFCEQVLLSIPFASLDAVDFKRDTVGNPTIDAKLHFTLHLDHGADLQLPANTVADIVQHEETQQ